MHAVCTLLAAAAAIASIVAWIWLIALMFRNGETVWAILLIVSIVIPIGPLIALVLFITRWSLVRRPALVLITSTAVGIIALTLSLASRVAGARLVASTQSPVIEVSTPSTPAEESLPDDDHRVEEETIEIPPVPATPPPVATPVKLTTPPRSVARASRARPAPDRGEAAGLSSQPSDSRAGPSTERSRMPAAERGRPPVWLKVVNLPSSGSGQMRVLRLQIGNSASQPIIELTVQLEYVSARGNLLGRWTTIHVPEEPIVDATATNTFDLRAFFVPQFTETVRAHVEAAVFQDGSRWTAY